MMITAETLCRRSHCIWWRGDDLAWLGRVTAM